MLIPQTPAPLLALVIAMFIYPDIPQVVPQLFLTIQYGVEAVVS